MDLEDRKDLVDSLIVLTNKKQIDWIKISNTYTCKYKDYSISFSIGWSPIEDENNLDKNYLDNKFWTIYFSIDNLNESSFYISNNEYKNVDELIKLMPEDSKKLIPSEFLTSLKSDVRDLNIENIINGNIEEIFSEYDIKEEISDRGAINIEISGFEHNGILEIINNWSSEFNEYKAFFKNELGYKDMSFFPAKIDISNRYHLLTLRETALEFSRLSNSDDIKRLNYLQGSLDIDVLSREYKINEMLDN